jgi:hypothetical protein
MRLGAEEVYDSLDVDVIDAIRRKHPDGVDAVLDVVNGADATQRDTGILEAGGLLVSTQCVTDMPWFAEQRITAENIPSVKNPLASRQGLAERAGFLAAGASPAGQKIRLRRVWPLPTKATNLAYENPGCSRKCSTTDRCGTHANGGVSEKAAVQDFLEALFRTRTGDPLLTMEVLYQLS